MLEDYGWPAWLIYIVLALAVILVGLILGFVRFISLILLTRSRFLQGVLMLIDYCFTGSSQNEIVDIPDDSRDVDDDDELVKIPGSIGISRTASLSSLDRKRKWSQKQFQKRNRNLL